jgi:hypothetical protein
LVDRLCDVEHLQKWGWGSFLKWTWAFTFSIIL